MVDPCLYFDLYDPYRGATPGFKFNKNLWFGVTNSDVAELQKRLSVYPQSGFFGPLTLAAVIKYQKANGITPAVGFVGPITRAKLNL
jgi:peptidoglycan hydrolase-like protein with peptidoglycan-binding domain